MDEVKVKTLNPISKYLEDYRNAENLFYIALILCIFAESAAQTMFPIPESVFTLCKMAGLAIITIKVFAFDRFSLPSFFLCIFLAIEAVLVMISSGYLNPLLWVMLLIGAKDIPFRKILKIFLVVNLSIVLAAFAASMLGIIVNLQYITTSRTIKSVRNSFGILYTTDFAAYFFFMMVVYFYLKGKSLRWFDYAGALILNAFIYYFCQTRLDCISILLTVILFAIVNATDNVRHTIRDKYKPRKNVLEIFAPFIMPACAVFSILITIAYNPSNRILNSINDLITHRLSLGLQGLEEYGIKLFGQYIRMVGMGLSTHLTDTYFFVDCSYLYVLLQYGLVFFLTMLVVYMFISYKNRKDHFFVIAILLVSINCMIAHHIVSFAYNPFAMALFALMSEERAPIPLSVPHYQRKKGKLRQEKALESKHVEEQQAEETVISVQSETSNSPSITWNFIMNSIFTVSSILFPLISFPYVSRILGPEKIGSVSFANSIVAYFLIIAQLGIPVYGVKACAQVRDDKETLSRVFSEIFCLNLIACLVAHIAFFAAVIFIPRMADLKLLFLIAGSSILLNMIGVQWFYQGLEKYSFITTCSVIFRVISLVLMFLLIKNPDDAAIYAGLHVLSTYGYCILTFIFLHRYVKIPKLSTLNLKQHLRPIFSFFAMSVSITVYTNLDTAMLGFMKSDLDVGYYTTAVRVKSLLVTFLSSLGTVLLPRTSFYLEKGLKEEAERLSKNALHFIFMLSLPMCVYFMLFSKETVMIIAGSEYIASITPMILIMPTLVFIGLTNIMGMQMLVPAGKEQTVMYSTIAGAIVDVILNLILIPRLASTGAALGTVAAELTVLIVQYTVLKKDYLFMSDKIKKAPFIAGLIISSMCALPVKLLSLNAFLTMIMSAVIFFGVYVIVLIIIKEPMMKSARIQIHDFIESKK